MSHLDEQSKRIVKTWSALELRDLPRTPEVIADWLGLAVGDVEKRMRALAGLQQLPGYSDE